MLLCRSASHNRQRRRCFCMEHPPLRLFNNSGVPQEHDICGTLPRFLRANGRVDFFPTFHQAGKSQHAAGCREGPRETATGNHYCRG